MVDTTSGLYRRFAIGLVTTALQDTPVVIVTGPRQCGKTTLVRSLVKGDRAFITLDDDIILASARSDPAGLLRGFDKATIDEVQRAPDLLRAIKRSVDEDRRAGRFLLTGSANLLTVPRISESLAGRMEIVNLLPLSRAEIYGHKPGFLKAAFQGKVSKHERILTGKDLVEAVLIGGYPEMLRRKEPERRRAWARDYIRAIVQRDVRDIAEVERLDQMPRLLQVLAHHSGQLTNFTQMGGQIGLDDKTTRKYVGVLEQLFLVRRVQPWFRNQLKRLVKTPKLHFLDSGLLAALLGATTEQVARDRAIFGKLLETFVYSEVLKQISWMESSCTLYHYRDKDQDEVDLVVEDGGAIVGIEVKASATVNIGDFKGLRKLAGACGDDFKLGVVLYDGERVAPFGKHLFAAPLSCLWG
ncbi:MAG TPA: ATP-binding protein [Acidobacteriaceae bacterium]|nr:ATP-binding protein [Acidobacteriaceae bacterium]